jgi:hypothetical protein
MTHTALPVRHSHILLYTGREGCHATHIDTMVNAHSLNPLYTQHVTHREGCIKDSLSMLCMSGQTARSLTPPCLHGMYVRANRSLAHPSEVFGIEP